MGRSSKNLYYLKQSFCCLADNRFQSGLPERHSLADVSKVWHHASIGRLNHALDDDYTLETMNCQPIRIITFLQSSRTHVSVFNCCYLLNIFVNKVHLGHCSLSALRSCYMPLLKGFYRPNTDVTSNNQWLPRSTSFIVCLFERISQCDRLADRFNLPPVSRAIGHNALRSPSWSI